VRLSCAAVHDDDDPCLGEPLCPQCFDYAAAVVWDNALSELWRRTTIYLPRTLARLTGITQKRLRALVRQLSYVVFDVTLLRRIKMLEMSCGRQGRPRPGHAGVAYVKVAEYQRRGLVHLHAVIRLDCAMPRYRAHELKPPPRRLGAELLEQALRATVDEVRAPLAAALGGGSVRWGDELDVRHVDANERRRVAGYLAKYSTKSTEQAGGVVHRVTEHEIDALPVREHVRGYLRQAFALADDPELARRRFGPCAHALGYRGHCLTKSRCYSTTCRVLRQARERHVHEELLAGSGDGAQRALAAATDRVASFRYAGQGHITAADALLAASAAARALEQRRAAREALAMLRLDEVTTEGRTDGDSAAVQQRYITPREAAARLLISERAVRNAIGRGELRAVKVCRRVRIAEEDFDAWVAAARIEAVAPPTRRSRTRAPGRGLRRVLQEREL
jgi:excisionase family DNA binding protein